MKFGGIKKERKHLKSSHDCLRAVCSNDLVNVFKVVARSRNHYHLDVLEAVFIKLHSPVLCQQKEFVKSFVFSVNCYCLGSLFLVSF